MHFEPPLGVFMNYKYYLLLILLISTMFHFH